MPCITLRDETEWVETVESGWNTLTGADKDRIIKAVARTGKLPAVSPKSVYGNGDAAERMVGILANFLGCKRD